MATSVHGGVLGRVQMPAPMQEKRDEGCANEAAQNSSAASCDETAARSVDAWMRVTHAAKLFIPTCHRESSQSCRCELVSMQMNGEDAEGHKPLASGIPCVGVDSQMHRSQAAKKHRRTNWTALWPPAIPSLSVQRRASKAQHLVQILCV